MTLGEKKMQTSIENNYLQRPYARILIPDEAGGFHAEVLEFPGCFAQGETPDEAYQDLEGAAQSWIEARLAQGQEIPEPFNNLGYSGKIALRLPRSIHRRAAMLAERDKVSLNSFLMTAIASRVGAEDVYTQIAMSVERGLMTTATLIAQAFTIAVSTSTSPDHFNFSVAPVIEKAGTEDTTLAVRR
jgi:predicted RNase H-like HicB family nuclease